jgi:type I restriction enzyme S subunit
MQQEIVDSFKYIETQTNALSSDQALQLDLLKKLRQQILQDAIHGRLVSQEPNDEPSSKLLERIKTEKEKLVSDSKIKKEKPLPEIRLAEISFRVPDNWVWCRLGEICVVEMGQSPDGETYNENGMGFPLINGPVEFGGKNPFDKTVKTKYTTSPTKLCKEGDLLICVRGSTTGRTNLAAFDACIGRGVAAIRPISYEKYVHYFIVYQRHDIFNLGRGSTFPNISQENLTQMVLPLPPLSEQHRIVYKIDQLLRLCDELEQSIHQNQKYTQELLQVALKEALEPKEDKFSSK